VSKASVHNLTLTKFSSDEFNLFEDLVAVEEPLEIRLGYGNKSHRHQKQVAVTMRTPGHDLELAVGFLFTEGIITSYSDIISVHHCEDVGRNEEKGNVVRVELQPELVIDFQSLDRNFYTTSSCGVCGKTSIDAIHTRQCYDIGKSNLVFAYELLVQLSGKVANHQTVFKHTGGIHASALFDLEGKIQLLREDVGRHNALDKLIGGSFLKDSIPLDNQLLWISGRASFELIQKAAMAGIAIIAAVGAPSSLAVELAESSGITLIGFLKNSQFNIYSHPQRIQ
jgi:FdhD protein